MLLDALRWFDEPRIPHAAAEVSAICDRLGADDVTLARRVLAGHVLPGTLAWAAQVALMRGCERWHVTAIPSFTAKDIGRRFTLKVTGYARSTNNTVEAVAVALVLPDGTLLERGFSKNGVPRVTVATDGIEEPARANDLLQAGFDRIDGPMLEATLEHTMWSSKGELAANG